VTVNRALFIHGAGDIRIRDYSPRAPESHETMVDVAAVGICGSDLHYYKDGGIGSAKISEPFIPGHEFSARMREDIPCEWCERAYHNLCPSVMFLGAPPYHGAMTGTLPVPKSALIKLPQDMTAEEGAMLEPLGVCIHAVDLAKPRLMESIAVLGCGGVGLGIIQLLVKTGCHKIIAIDPQKHRADMAAATGASVTGVNIDIVKEATDGRGCDLVIEATNSPDGMADAILSATIGARIIFVGIPDEDTYSQFSAAQARRRGLDIRFSRRMGHVYERAIKLVQHSHIDVESLISHRFSLEESEAAFKLQVDKAPGLIKSMILPNQ